jgi:hypothetical protein
MRKFVGCAVVFACLGFAGAVQAAPLLQLAGDINSGTLFCATDNNVGCANGVTILDLNPTVGVLDLGSSTIAGLLIEGSIQQETFGPPFNILNSSSINIENTTASAISAQLSVSADNYLGLTSFIANSGSGTWQTAEGSTATYSFYADPNNGTGGQTATDRPGFLVSSFTDTAVGLVDSFAVNYGPVPFVDPGPFSMTLGFDMTLEGGGSLISRGQTQITDVSAVPEPLSLSLLGMGLFGVGYRLRRRS